MVTFGGRTALCMGSPTGRQSGDESRPPKTLPSCMSGERSRPPCGIDGRPFRGRVGGTHCCVPPPSSQSRSCHSSRHTAQASPRGDSGGEACVALKILCRSRRTCSSCTGQMIWSQSRPSSSGPFTVMGVQLVLRFGWVRCCRRQRLTRHTSARMTGPGTRPGIRPVIQKPPGWKVPGLRLLLSCCLSATGIRFLGVLFPPQDSASLLTATQFAHDGVVVDAEVAHHVMRVLAS